MLVLSALVLSSAVHAQEQVQDRVQLLEGSSETFVMDDMKSGQCELEIKDLESGYSPLVELTATKSKLAFDFVGIRYLSSWTHQSSGRHALVAIKSYSGDRGRKFLTVFSNISYLTDKTDEIVYKKTQLEIVIDPRSRVERFNELNQRETRSAKTLALVDNDSKNYSDYEFRSVYQDVRFKDGRLQFNRKSAIGVLFLISCAL